LVDASEFRLGDRGLLLHIGPHKTGTTAIQGSLAQAREAMAEVGVIYPGKARAHQMSAIAVTGARGLVGERSAKMGDWERLVRECGEAADQRVVVSSEYFDEATDAQARQVVEDLGSKRVHVVITLRPLAKIMPSAWQQYVRNMHRGTYSDWLEGMLRKAPYKQPTPSFWRRHDHEVLVERWAATVGPERLLVMVVDDTNRLGILRDFERVIGLPDGLLEPAVGADNRSLTAAEAEIVRELNVICRKQQWPDELYDRFVRQGVIETLQGRARAANAASLTLPPWALERANEIAATAAQAIEEMGVNVLGDLSRLGSVTATTEWTSPADAIVAPAEAAAAIEGLVTVSLARDAARDLADSKRAKTLPETTSGELVRVLNRRLRKRAAKIRHAG
jgi:hypothetical protein